MSRMSFASPFRPKIQSAKRFLSLQVSQASHVISDELSNILKSKSSNGKKRRRIIDEIFSTEQSYQEHLQLVTTLFLSPLRERNILPDHVVSAIFSNIEAIQNVNRELLTHMETMGLGDAFLALAPFLKLYSTYANNFEKAMNTIKEWEKKCPKFSSFKVQQEELEEAKGLKLNALLITPIQRVPRYKMLLENLLWKTPEDHADFDKVKEAVDQISKIAIHINENIRQHENFQKMTTIQNSFSGEGAPKIMAPGRSFLKEGTLLKVGKRGWGASKERTFFLFSDILIYSKKNNLREKETGKSYICLDVFPLINCKVQEVMGDGNTSEGGALFSIECQDKCLLLFSKSQGEAKSWLNEIRTAIDGIRNSKSSLRKLTRPGYNLRKRRAPTRKTNERRTAGVSGILASPYKMIPSQLNCLSPRKGNRLLALREESSEELCEEEEPNEEQFGSNEEQYGSNEEQCGSNEEQCGSNEEQCGSNEEQCGSNEEQCGSNEEQCGSNEEQCGSNEEQCGSNEEQCGSNEESFENNEMKDSDSSSRTEDCKDDKENVGENGDCGKDCKENVLKKPPKICERTGVKRKFDDCDFSHENLIPDRVPRKKSTRLSGWLLNCGSSFHTPQ